MDRLFPQRGQVPQRACRQPRLECINSAVHEDEVCLDFWEREKG